MDLPVISRVLYQSKLRARWAGDSGTIHKRFDLRRGPVGLKTPCRAGRVMPAASQTPQTQPLVIGRKEVLRTAVVIVAIAIVAGAFLTPWWTRGLSLPTVKGAGSSSQSGQDLQKSLVEGQYVNYGPYSTPQVQGLATDPGRETATAVLGIAASLAIAFAFASLWVRWSTFTGRIATTPSLAVRLAIVASVVGVFTVLWGAFFVPLLGPNPGWLYAGKTVSQSVGNSISVAYETTRYANVGFFLGILGFVGFPAYLWVDAHLARSADPAYSPERVRLWTPGEPPMAT